jgi:DNA polymerase-3 subunit epsilon
MSIDEITFVVTDTETTGTVSGRDRLIEIGAVKIRGGEIIDRYEQLVNPGCAIPNRITRLTGISTSMVYDQPAAHRILPDYLTFLSDGVFVAHNLAFDRRVINDELLRAGMNPIHNDQLCTLRLARRLLPGLRSRGLSSLVDFFRIQMERRHRALDDAEATGKVLMRLLSRMNLEAGILRLDDLLHVQNMAYGKSVPHHIIEIRSRLSGRLPRRPGVYFMKDADGRILYVGKAKSLRSRVSSYFNAVEAQPGRIRQLLDAVRDVTWEETDTELEALLAESRLIKELRPRFNRALKRYSTRPFIKLDRTSRFPTVSSVRYIVDDGAEYYGPVQGQRHAEWIVDLIHRMFGLRVCDDNTLQLGRRCFYGETDRCLTPCEADDNGAYLKQVERVREFLQGHDDEILQLLEEEMRACAAREEFEDARLYRDSIERLRRLIDRSETIAAPVFSRNVVLVLPESGRSRARLYFVRFGRLARTLTVAPDPTEPELRSIRFLTEKLFASHESRPERYMRQEVDEIRILANWIHANRRKATAVTWSPHLSVAVFLQSVQSAIKERVGGESVSKSAESTV